MVVGGGSSYKPDDSKQVPGAGKHLGTRGKHPGKQQGVGI